MADFSVSGDRDHDPIRWGPCPPSPDPLQGRIGGGINAK